LSTLRGQAASLEPKYSIVKIACAKTIIEGAAGNIATGLLSFRTLLIGAVT